MELGSREDERGIEGKGALVSQGQEGGRRRRYGTDLLGVCHELSSERLSSPKDTKRQVSLTIFYR